MVFGGAIMRNALISGIGFVIVFASFLVPSFRSGRSPKRSHDESVTTDQKAYPHNSHERPQRLPKENFKIFGSWKFPWGGSGW